MTALRIITSVLVVLVLTAPAFSIPEEASFPGEYAGHIQTEQLVTGEIVSINHQSRTINLKTFGGSLATLNLPLGIPLFINDAPSSIEELGRGDKVAMVCRWQGLDSDRPDILMVHLAMDGRTFVLRNLALEYGGLISPGRVVEVDPSKRIMTISLGKGVTCSVSYDDNTRWIPATSRIQSVSDFIGHRVFVFGPDDGNGKARMVLNELGVVSMFELMARQGRFIKPSLILASGPVVDIEESYLTVKREDGPIKIFTPGRTAFIRNNRLIDRKNINPGDQVMVKGTMGRHMVASEVICR